MAVERTLSIIKPDATARNLTGRINAKFEEAGLRIVAQRRMRLSVEQAGEFYAVHRERPFFGELTTFMASGPVVVQVLEGEDAVSKNREVMGATNPKDAAPRHHPRRVRAVGRREQRARLGRARDGGAGDRLLLLGHGHRRLSEGGAAPRRIRAAPGPGTRGDPAALPPCSWGTAAWMSARSTVHSRPPCGARRAAAGRERAGAPLAAAPRARRAARGGARGGPGRAGHRGLGGRAARGGAPGAAAGRARALGADRGGEPLGRAALRGARQRAAADRGARHPRAGRAGEGRGRGRAALRRVGRGRAGAGAAGGGGASRRQALRLGARDRQPGAGGGGGGARRAAGADRRD